MLSAVGDLVGVVSVDDLGRGALVAFSLMTTAVTMGALASFRHTDWYAWQRTKPPAHDGAPIGALVLVGVLFGVLGGPAGPVDDGIQVNVRVADPRLVRRAPATRQFGYAGPTRLLGSLGTAAVVDAEYDDLMSGVVDPIQDPVGAPPRGVDPGEVTNSGFPTRRGFSISEPVRNSTIAAAIGYGNRVWRARTAGGVRTSS